MSISIPEILKQVSIVKSLLVQELYDGPGVVSSDTTEKSISHLNIAIMGLESLTKP